MRVICIDGVFYTIAGTPVYDAPKEGEVCEVLGTFTGYISKITGYMLEGYGENKYDVTQFAPLSEIDETEFIREYKTETV